MLRVRPGDFEKGSSILRAGNFDCLLLFGALVF